MRHKVCFLRHPSRRCRIAGRPASGEPTAQPCKLNLICLEVNKQQVIMQNFPNCVICKAAGQRTPIRIVYMEDRVYGCDDTPRDAHEKALCVSCSDIISSFSLIPCFQWYEGMNLNQDKIAILMKSLNGYVNSDRTCKYIQLLDLLNSDVNTTVYSDIIILLKDEVRECGWFCSVEELASASTFSVGFVDYDDCNLVS